MIQEVNELFKELEKLRYKYEYVVYATPLGLMISEKESRKA